MSSAAIEQGVAPGEVSGLVSGQKKSLLSITFHIETLRMIAFINFDIVMIVCSFLTKHYVDIPTDETVIYKIFGFNHACNVLDHHPARELGAILLIFMILPFAAFIFLSHYRTRYAYETGEVPKWLLVYSNITSPFNFMAVCWTYMWFVNAPDDTYGFVAHYIPYLAFQTMLALVAFHQVAYLIYLNKVPFGVSPKVAIGYAIFLTLLTIVYTVYVVSILVGSPVWDSVNNAGDRLFAEIVAKIYSVFVLIIPIILAAVERRNGDVHTLSFS